MTGTDASIGRNRTTGSSHLAQLSRVYSDETWGVADWLIDLGPGPGRHGGTILFEGHVADYTDQTTPTGHALSHPDLDSAWPKEFINTRRQDSPSKPAM